MRKKRTWFYRLVTTYLPIVYSLVFVLFFVFFMTVSQLSQRQTERANEAFTRYALLQLDSILSGIDQSMNTETTNVNNKAFNQYMFNMYEQGSNPFLLRKEVADRFYQIKSSFPFIHSIYFYRNVDMTVLGNDLYVPLSEFGDRTFLRQELQRRFSSEWTGIRSYKELDSQAYDSKVVSLVKKVPFLSDPSGIMVVNLDMSSLDTWLKSISDGAISSIRLKDHEGNKIGESRDRAGRDILTLTSEVTGWSFQSGIKNTYHYGMFSDLFYSWMILGIVMLLAASIGIVILSKKYARPIDASVNRISEYLQGKQNGQSADSGFIQHVDAAVDRIIDYANRYQSESNSNLPYRQKHFFNELLTGDREIGNEELREEMRMFGFPAGWRYYHVAMLEIDRMTDFSEGYSQRDQVLMKFVLTNVLKELTEQQGIGCWSEWLSSDKLGILFGAEEEICSPAMSVVCESMRAWVETNLAFTVTIGIGGSAARPDEVRTSCEQAVKALQYRSTLGHNRVIDYIDTARRTETELFDLLQLIRTIVQAFKNGGDDWTNGYRFLFAAIGRGLYSRDELKNLFNYLMFTFTRELSEFPQEYSDVWRQEGMIPISQAIDEFETLEEMKELLYGRLSQVAEKWKELREGRSQRQLIHEVKDYIEQHYSNSDLSLQLLSEQFDISKNYISRLFKDETGVNFIDYVTEIRMRRAKQLMEEAELSIQDIAEQVGYEHYFTFNRAFKKLMGFPPSDFRRRIT